MTIECSDACRPAGNSMRVQRSQLLVERNNCAWRVAAITVSGRYGSTSTIAADPPNGPIGYGLVWAATLIGIRTVSSSQRIESEDKKEPAGGSAHLLARASANVGSPRNSPIERMRP